MSPHCNRQRYTVSPTGVEGDLSALEHGVVIKTRGVYHADTSCLANSILHPNSVASAAPTCPPAG